MWKRVGEQWNLPSVWNTKKTWSGNCVVQFWSSLCTDGPSPTKNRGERNMKLRALHQFVSRGPNSTWHVNSLIGMGRWITMRRPLYRLILHYEAANLIPFSVLESVWTSIGRILLSCTVWKKKLAGILGRCCFYVLYNSPRESIDIAKNQVSHTASTCRRHRHAALRFPCWWDVTLQLSNLTKSICVSILVLWHIFMTTSRGTVTW